ncbi:esterase-like activity of phytase family protein [Paucibacter sp. DJ2R-2]|uniref:esterase-like activity of phytase family protein n=1 Tax=Paucibacter sp. DJ2R-2 TaxID=2893558 RepID=UPI0021E4E802|nr:esterase-like activity of phytase family protein [Paucibacter sp. DJ2R-2]MCV2420895.1 esterase-like activity of phytase family protein [Paucibacter sp. DJ4R-1]MCV2440094.1 esterase-like activity of phytase family protein [Paucibacter sp. DJ2R-2]
MKSKTPALRLLAALGCVALSLPAAAQLNTLVGWAKMPANTFADGPTSGQFASGAGGNPLPLLNKQPVQGFSAVLNGPTAGSYLFMPDNGFGTQGNSGDTLLRMYAVTPDFKTALGGSGTVSAANYQTGTSLTAFNADSRINLADPDRKLGFKIQADYTNYYNNAANPLVDASIRSGRLLTGADFDIESVRKDKNGNLWFGEEFGPFLLKADATGKVLRAEVGMGGVMSPQNPYLNGGVATLGASRGFEGMAINPAGDMLYTLLEGTVSGDAPNSLRINAFSVDQEAYTGQRWLYKLDAAGTNIGDMTALNDHEFIIIERNNATATAGGTPFKKLFRIDLNRVDAQGYVSKTELVDLMNIADPNDLNGDGSNTFTFPFVTIESVLVLDENTLLIANDNNYPGTGGRDLGSDNTEFLKIQLANPVPEPSSYAMLLGGLGLMGAWLRRRKSV